ncbi:lysophospholipid acyltransferase family protein [Sphingomonas sp. H39-1-10]|uniref:lysophospholipid acyltransferase family protein n=1 Tax=Sphingomonas pollutisoli TaxID=3030829 RepID=UPI0023B91274|nr:lysophospholipid acyltransferase family protein [Sphingomonas pollutisoli]MDF0488150.1 lysophospholipid acyltransferase family protein [Sphingomonas pollutisoli]
MIGLRNLAFAVVFYGGSVAFVLLSPLAAAIGRPALLGLARAWIGFHRWAARALLGIETRIVGDPQLGTPALYAAKHQSMYETLELSRILNRPAIVMKQELADIPIWGRAARRYGVIVVDREASAGALRRMLGEAKVALDAGRSIVIFPEGTRVAPGERPALKSGFAGLYQMLKLPVVPVALDSGRVWPRRGPKRPGVVTIRFGEPIPPGLSRKEAEARVHAAINALERD